MWYGSITPRLLLDIPDDHGDSIGAYVNNKRKAPLDVLSRYCASWSSHIRYYKFHQSWGTFTLNLCYLISCTLYVCFILLLPALTSSIIATLMSFLVFCISCCSSLGWLRKAYRIYTPSVPIFFPLELSSSSFIFKVISLFVFSNISLQLLVAWSKKCF